MSHLRWLATFLGFPLGGFLAILIVGPIHSPVSAALSGAIAGLGIGGAQWLALRSRGIPPLWALYTSAAMAVGTVLATLLISYGTDLQALILRGLIAGASVGTAQAVLLQVGRRARVGWAVVVAVGWALGWLTTWSIGVDVERAYATFGASGALVVTLLTGLPLAHILPTARPAPRSLAPEVAA